MRRPPWTWSPVFHHLGSLLFGLTESLLLVTANPMGRVCPQHADQFHHRPVALLVCLCVSAPTLPSTGEGGLLPIHPDIHPLLQSHLVSSQSLPPPHCGWIHYLRQSSSHPDTGIPRGPEGVVLHSGSSSQGGIQENGTQVYRIITHSEDHQPHSDKAKTPPHHESPPYIPRLWGQTSKGKPTFASRASVSTTSSH